MGSSNDDAFSSSWLSAAAALSLSLFLHLASVRVSCQASGMVTSTRPILNTSPGMKGTRPQLAMLFRHVAAPLSAGQMAEGLTPRRMAMPNGIQNRPHA